MKSYANNNHIIYSYACVRQRQRQSTQYYIPNSMRHAVYYFSAHFPHIHINNIKPRRPICKPVKTMPFYINHINYILLIQFGRVRGVCAHIKWRVMPFIFEFMNLKFSISKLITVRNNFHMMGVNGVQFIRLKWWERVDGNDGAASEWLGNWEITRKFNQM